VAEHWNANHATHAVADYDAIVQELPEVDYSSYLAEAQAFNQALAEQENQFYLSDEMYQRYLHALTVGDSDVMGYINIPLLGVTLPIYHTTDEAVLQEAVGHLVGSSLPVGGPSTHTVLSGHRGLSSAKLFTNLNKMQLGDTFSLHVLGDVLTYEVDQIETVLPDEMDLLRIEPGADYCTLVTCTPFGVNSHRLLVRGHRIPTPEVERPVITLSNPSTLLTFLEHVSLYDLIAYVELLGIALFAVYQLLRLVRRQLRKK
jgi:sortase A